MLEHHLHPHPEPLSAAWALQGWCCRTVASKRPGPQLSTAQALTTSSQTWDLPCRVPRGCCTSSPHHHSVLNLSSFPGDDPNKVINPFVTGVFGALAGAASVFGNTPLDVVKTRMQVRQRDVAWDRSACDRLGSPAVWEPFHAAPAAGARCWRGLGDAWGR